MCPCCLADSKQGNRCLAKATAHCRLLSQQWHLVAKMDTCHISHFCADYWFPLVFVAELLEQHRWTRWRNKVEIAFLKVHQWNFWISSHLLRSPRCETFKAAVINVLVIVDEMSMCSMKMVHRKQSAYSAVFLRSIETYSLFQFSLAFQFTRMALVESFT